jgi:hypothetical protein
MAVAARRRIWFDLGSVFGSIRPVWVAFLEETDDKGRMPAAGKVALVAIVGNKDGAHHCHAPNAFRH